MGSGQIMLTIAALMLLSITILNMNKNLTQVDASLIQNKTRMEALSLISSYVEQTSQYVFDEAVADTMIKNPQLVDFTSPGLLGLESSDYGVINDFDDFHGLTVSDTGKSGVVFNIHYEVEYVKLDGDKIVKSNSKEYHKRMTISIYDDYDAALLFRYENGARVKDTLRISFVNSFWFYN